MTDKEIYATAMKYDDRMLRHSNLDNDPIFQALKGKIAGHVREQDRAKYEPGYKMEKAKVKDLIFT